MKKKSLFRKALSLICCVAMCLTTFIPVIDAATVSSVTVKVPSGTSLIANDFSEIEADGSTNAYDYSRNAESVVFTLKDTQTQNTIVFYADSELKPTVEGGNLFCNVSISDTSLSGGDNTNYWTITITVNRASNYNFELKPGVQTYDVTFTNGTDYTFMNTNGTLLKSGTFAKGDTISFTLNGVTDGKTAVIRENSVDLAVNAAKGNLAYNDKTGVYTYTVNNDATISAVLKDVTYSVTVPATQTGYTLVSADGKYEVAHGGTFTFYVRTTDEKYNAITAANITAKDSKGAQLTVNQVSDTQYTINNITDAVEITVATPGVKQYDITLIGGTGSTIEEVNSSSPVNHGGSFTFKVTVGEAYKASTPVISINGTPIQATFVDGVCNYTIEGITEAKTVSVSNLTMNTYNVTLTPGKGYTLSPIGNTTVTHGSNFQFRLDLAAGYENPIVKVGDKVITSENGIYTINEVNDNVVVSVEVESKTFKVIVYDKDNIHAKVNSNITSIFYNESYLFTVEANPGYSIASVSVNNAVVTPIGDTYTVRNVVDDLTIVVETVENTLTVNYESTEKNHEYAKTIVYTYTQLKDAVAFPTLKECKLHTFDGWFNGGEKVTALNAFASDIASANKTLTLTAKYEVTEDTIKRLLSFEKTEGEATKLANGTYRITFRTAVKVSNIDDACVDEFVKIVKHGTILANTEYVDFSTVKFEGTDVSVTGVYNGIKSDDGKGNDVYFYFVDCNYSWSAFSSALVTGDAKSSIILRVNGVNEKNTLNAAGWVEVKVGDKTFRIISAESGIVEIPAN